MTNILFLGKKDDDNTLKALEFCQHNFEHVDNYLGGWEDKWPEAVEWLEPDYTISYLSRWKIPEVLLRRTKKAAINFHPAPPEYPGFAPNNFALYEGVSNFGVTCHHMAEKIDTGAIIAVDRFPIYSNDTIATLQQRTYDHQIVLFYRVMGYILDGINLPSAGYKWKSVPYTRKQFLALNEITPDLNAEEIARRIRATSFGKFQPSIKLHGFEFELKVK